MIHEAEKIFATVTGSKRILRDTGGPRFLAESVVEGGQLQAVGAGEFDQVGVGDVGVVCQGRQFRSRKIGGYAARLGLPLRDFRQDANPLLAHRAGFGLCGLLRLGEVHEAVAV